jgi:hypothetical protein
MNAFETIWSALFVISCTLVGAAAGAVTAQMLWNWWHGRK